MHRHHRRRIAGDVLVEDDVRLDPLPDPFGIARRRPRGRARSRSRVGPARLCLQAGEFALAPRAIRLALFFLCLALRFLAGRIGAGLAFTLPCLLGFVAGGTFGLALLFLQGNIGVFLFDRLGCRRGRDRWGWRDHFGHRLPQFG
ncbi:hypothetical protein D3C81_1253210 [compost metagenome]